MKQIIECHPSIALDHGLGQSLLNAFASLFIIEIFVISLAQNEDKKGWHTWMFALKNG